MTQQALPTPFSHLGLDRVGSTNDEARRQALSGAAADLLVVTATEQSAGRGRRGRQWISPPGNLHCSILIRIDSLASAAQLGFAAAAALVRALAGLLPDHKPEAKWPNDVLLNRRKVAGMLLEPVGQEWLILGLGVDVAHCPPADTVAYPVTSLAEAGYDGDAFSVLRAFFGEFQPLLESWRSHGFGPVREAWLPHARGIGAPVVVRLERETLTGLFAGLDEQGALLLDAGSTMRRIMAGDVFFPPA